jgi:hypothetical protein
MAGKLPVGQKELLRGKLTGMVKQGEITLNPDLPLLLVAACCFAKARQEKSLKERIPRQSLPSPQGPAAALYPRTSLTFCLFFTKFV